ncbi:unnamed protein product [Ixodes hexagonus]
MLCNWLYLSVFMIYYSAEKTKIVTTFLSLCVLEACTADGIVEAIKHVLRVQTGPVQHGRHWNRQRQRHDWGQQWRVPEVESRSAESDPCTLRVSLLTAGHFRCCSGLPPSEPGIHCQRDLQLVFEVSLTTACLQKAVQRNK